MDQEKIRKAEAELTAAEDEVMVAKSKVTRLRSALLRINVDDYTLTSPDGKAVQLSALFGDSKDMILVHNMGKGCSYCTMWADGFNSLVPHMEDRGAFIVVSPNEPSVVKEFSESRGWKFKMFSAHGTTLFKDLGFESKEGNPWPGVSSLYRDDTGKMERVSRAVFGPGDDFCSVWHFLDLLNDGPNGWEPKYKYD